MNKPTKLRKMPNKEAQTILKNAHDIMSKGTLLYDFFIIPTIRIDWSNKDFDYGFTRVTVEWLRWYVGFTIKNCTEHRVDCVGTGVKE